MAMTCYLVLRNFYLQKRNTELVIATMKFLFPAGFPLQSRGGLNSWCLANENNLPSNDTCSAQKTLRWQMMTFSSIPSHSVSDMPIMKVWFREFPLQQEWLTWEQPWWCCLKQPVPPHCLHESPTYLEVTGLLPALP